MSEDDKEWLKGTPFSKWITRLEELEKKINDSLLLPTIVTHGTDHTELQERIEKLESRLDSYRVQDNVSWTSLREELSNVKNMKIFDHIYENENEIKSLKEHDVFRIWNSMRTGGKTTLKAFLYDVQRNTEILRELIEFGIHGGDSSFLLGLLRKLGGDPAQNRIDRLDRGFEILKKHEEAMPYANGQDKLGVEKSKVLSGQGLTDILPTSDFPSDSNPPRCKKCSNPMEFDLHTLNSGDWYCPYCVKKSIIESNPSIEYTTTDPTKQIKTHEIAPSASHTEKCAKCSGLMEYHRKFKDQDENTIYVFRCSKCKEETLTEYPEQFKEKEPTELYPSPYSKEQENFGKYIQVKGTDLKYRCEDIWFLIDWIRSNASHLLETYREKVQRIERDNDFFKEKYLKGEFYNV